MSVPNNNAPALGLFRKLGFVLERTRDLCGTDDPSASTASMMAMSAIESRAWQALEPRSRWTPIVTVTGLPGSGSGEVAADIARKIGSRFIDAEISTKLCRRLQCSI